MTFIIYHFSYFKKNDFEKIYIYLQDNWDEEDDVEDDFVNQLREQIAKNPNGK